MKCILHEDREAKGVCTICEKPFCDECLVETDNKLYCKEHALEVLKNLDDTNNSNDKINNNENFKNQNIENNNNNKDVISVSNNLPIYSKKSKLVTILLCIFLGTFGFHRFYVGKIGTGILYLFTLGLFGIGWIIDLVTIALGTFKDKNGYFLE